MYPNLFKSRYSNLTGRDWIKQVSPEDFQAFIQIGLSASEYGRLGGIARASKAKRDSRGRFIKEA